MVATEMAWSGSNYHRLFGRYARSRLTKMGSAKGGLGGRGIFPKSIADTREPLSDIAGCAGWSPLSCENLSNRRVAEKW
jgi:hypothetical protein